MLLQLRDYLRREKVASNQQLAREFKLDNQALLPMLEIWVKKGVIARCEKTAGCQSQCFKCQTTPPVYYQYLTSGEATI